MTKLTIKSTKTSAVFLAAVLYAGTFALISPSFIGGVQAEPYFKMDNKNDKSNYQSYDKDKFDKSKDNGKKQSPNCINANLIILGVNSDPLTRQGIAEGLQGLPGQTDEIGEENAWTNGLLNEENGFSFDRNFVNVCNIKNNNNVLAAEEEQPPEPQPTNLWRMFTQVLDEAGIDIADVNQRLAASEATLNDIPVRSIAQICNVLDNAATPVDRGDVQQVLLIALPQGTPDRTALIQAILDCLEEIGLIE